MARPDDRLVQPDLNNVEWASEPPGDLPRVTVCGYLNEATGAIVSGDLYGPRDLFSEEGRWLDFGWVFVPQPMPGEGP